MMEKQYAFLCFNTAFVFHKKIYEIYFQYFFSEYIPRTYKLQSAGVFLTVLYKSNKVLQPCSECCY